MEDELAGESSTQARSSQVSMLRGNLERRIFNGCPMALLTEDCRGRIIGLNAAGERLLGYSEGELAGQGWALITAHGSLPRAWQDAAQNGGGRAFETTLVGKTGRRIDVSVGAAPWFEKGQFGGVVSVLVPRSTEAGKWAEVLASQLAESLHLARLVQDARSSARRTVAAPEELQREQRRECFGRLADGVAHDMNNVLSVVQGHAALAALDLPPEHPAMTDLQAIQEGCRRATALTRRLATLGQKTARGCASVNLDECLPRLLRTLGLELMAQTELVLNLEAGLGRVAVDSEGLEQVLQCLARSAVRAIPGGGTLRVVARRQQPGLAGAGGMNTLAGNGVCLSLTHSGIVCDGEALFQLLEPYGKEWPGSGGGLDLAVAEAIVRQHGGRIDVESEAERGTTFHIWLPEAHPSPTRCETDAMSERLVGGKETILLAEDDPGVREFTSTLLRRLGYSVLEAADGQQALDVFTAHRQSVQLLVLDTRMPVLSGPCALATIRQRGEAVPVLFVTGDEGGLDPDLVTGPLTALIAKPFGLLELDRCVRDLLERAGS
jgi:PAS domain S-box-containing protein